MSYEEKVSAVCSIINNHNKVISDDFKEGDKNLQKLLVDTGVFIQNVKSIGGTTEDALKSFSHEDIADCLPLINDKKPVILAKQIAHIFRSISQNEKDIISYKKSKNMGYKELIENYDPRTNNNSITKRLKEIIGDKAFIVFDNDVVNVEVSLKLFNEILNGYPPRESIQINGNWELVHKIGYCPNNLYDENPIYRGRALRPDGTCDQTQRSWDGIGLKSRQIVTLAIEIGELKPTIEQAHDILDLLLSPNGEQKLIERCPNACIKYNSLTKLGNLPTLKMSLDTFSKSSPLENPKKVEFLKK